MTRQIPLPLPHDEAMEADDYVVTSSNREASEWISSWPNWPAHCLVLTGPAGSGKTHLLNLWLQHSHGKCLNPEDLSRFDAGQLAMSNKHIAIDNADTIATNRDALETLFHLYNLLKETKGSLLVACSRPVAEWSLTLADLRSRLSASPLATLGAPDDALMSMLLVKQFHDRQIEIGSDVLAYLLPRMERTTQAIRAIVTDLDRASLAEGKAVTVSLVKRILHDQA